MGPVFRRLRTVVRSWLPAVLAVLLLAGCAGKAPRSRLPATQRPYTVKGVTYTPLQSAKGFREEGLASWYGPGFHGCQTSCGEIYDQYKLTCAHKLLPMHTMVRVTNLKNGRSTVLRVNDRGPFVAGRIVDVSRAGAQELGIYAPGTARVRLEVVGDVPGVAPGGELPGPFYVQVGAFVQRENAVRLLPRVVAGGYAGSRIIDQEIEGTRYWRVLAGTFGSVAAAEEARRRLVMTYAGAFVIAQ